MTSISLVVASEFSDAPGARYPEDGPDSGQQFYLEFLKPRFEEALQKREKLVVDLDGTFGYATSFISESFGRLSKDFGAEEVFKVLDIKSDEDPSVEEYARLVIQSPDSQWVE